MSSLYHLTHIRNLPLIARLDGLVSKAELVRRNLHPQVDANRDEQTMAVDYLVGNWDKVRLTWCAIHPMFFRMGNTQYRCLIRVKPMVALGPDVVFTDRNSHDGDSSRAGGLEGLGRVDFSAVQQRFPLKSERIKRNKQAEVIVPEVNLNDFVRVHFWDWQAYKTAMNTCQDFPELTRLFDYDPDFIKEQTGRKKAGKQLRLI